MKFSPWKTSELCHNSLLLFGNSSTLSTYKEGHSVECKMLSCQKMSHFGFCLFGFLISKILLCPSNLGNKHNQKTIFSNRRISEIKIGKNENVKITQSSMTGCPRATPTWIVSLILSFGKLLVLARGLEWTLKMYEVIRHFALLPVL